MNKYIKKLKRSHTSYLKLIEYEEKEIKGKTFVLFEVLIGGKERKQKEK